MTHRIGRAQRDFGKVRAKTADDEEVRWRLAGTLSLQRLYCERFTFVVCFLQPSMLPARRFCSFLRLGMVGLLTLRSGLFTSALKTVQLFAPVSTKYPEVAQALKADAHINDIVAKLVSETTLLGHYSDAERTQQIEQFHLPTYLYVKTLLQRHRTAEHTKPLFVGISAPQVQVIHKHENNAYVTYLTWFSHFT